MWLASRTSAEEHEETGHYHSHSGCGQRHQSKRNDPRKRADEKSIRSQAALYSIHQSISTPSCHHASRLGNVRLN